jgi:hypothetical protein
MFKELGLTPDGSGINVPLELDVLADDSEDVGEEAVN